MSSAQDRYDLDLQPLRPESHVSITHILYRYNALKDSLHEPALSLALLAILERIVEFRMDPGDGSSPSSSQPLDPYQLAKFQMIFGPLGLRAYANSCINSRVKKPILLRSRGICSLNTSSDSKYAASPATVAEAIDVPCVGASGPVSTLVPGAQTDRSGPRQEKVAAR